MDDIKCEGGLIYLKDTKEGTCNCLMEKTTGAIVEYCELHRVTIKRPERHNDKKDNLELPLK